MVEWVCGGLFTIYVKERTQFSVLDELLPRGEAIELVIGIRIRRMMVRYKSMNVLLSVTTATDKERQRWGWCGCWAWWEWERKKGFVDILPMRDYYTLLIQSSPHVQGNCRRNRACGGGALLRVAFPPTTSYDVWQLRVVERIDSLCWKVLWGNSEGVTTT